MADTPKRPSFDPKLVTGDYVPPALPPKRDQVSQTYTAQVQALNEEYAVARIGSKVCIITDEWTNNLGHNRYTVRFLSERDFHLLLANQTLPYLDGRGDIKQIPLTSIWITHPDRQTYQGFGLYPPPLVAPAQTYNLWRNYGIEARAGKWTLIYNHFKNVLAGGNKVHLDYLLSWCAYGLRNPAVKMETAILLRGGQGAGKGTLGYLLLKCWGTHGIHLQKKDQLTGRFSAHLMNALFAHVDEATFAGDRAAAAVLKSLITEKRWLIEPKRIDAFEMANLMRVLFTANPKHAMHLDSDDRRIAAFDVEMKSRDLSKRQQYFGALYHEIDHGGAEAFLSDMLYTWDLTNFDERNIPNSAARAAQKTESLKATEAWWHDVLSTGNPEPWKPSSYSDRSSDYCTGPENTATVSRDWLYKSYLEWVDHHRDEYTSDKRNSFFRKLREMVWVKDHTINKIPMVELPSLDRAREQFERWLEAEGMVGWK